MFGWEKLERNEWVMDNQGEIVIFGAGNFGKMAIDYYGSERVFCFVDNSNEKIGKEFCGKPVISFGNLLKIKEDYKIVVATNAYYKEIVRQLKEAGINKFSLYFSVQYANAIDTASATRELEGKNVVLLGIDENIERLVDDLLERDLKIKKLMLADTEGSMSFGKSYKGRSVQEFTKVKKSAEVVIVASQSRAYALQAYLNREVQGEKKVINPFIQTAYYDTKELVFNSYCKNANDVTEEEWNDALKSNFSKAAMGEYVAELNKSIPLFEHVEVETINRCNGKCSFCPVSAAHDIREKRVMEETLFKKIVDQLAELGYSGKFAAFSNNEPFLDPRIIEFNRYAREKLPNARLHLFTNGTVMPLEKFKGIIKYLDELVIDNYSQDFELGENSKAVKAYCEKHPELKKKVTIVMRKEQEILTSRGGDAPNRNRKESYPQDKCSLPFKQLIIRPDGKVSLCCNDPYGRITLGDANYESLTEIWYGDKFAEVRKKLSQGRGMLEHCRYCDTFILW